MTDTCAGTLQQWARLGRELSAETTVPKRPFADVFAQLIPAGVSLRDAEFEELESVVAQTREMLRPLGEPLEHDIGIIRWLSSAREEAYSDCLAWLFSQMTMEELGSVLGLGELLSLGTELPSSTAIEARREVWVPEGHPGQEGRLDILLVGKDAIVVVEVKLGTVEEADTAKQRGYFNSVNEDLEFRRMKTKCFVMLATDGGNRSDVEGFKVRGYATLCRNLRRLAKAWCARDDRFFSAALTLAITASLEVNLLGMSITRSSFTPATLQHLEMFYQECAYERYE